jgi:hypothetical protein
MGVDHAVFIYGAGSSTRRNCPGKKGEREPFLFLIGDALIGGTFIMGITAFSSFP